MSGVYSMTGPTYSGLSKLDLLDSAMSQPLSITSTLIEEGKGGAAESFGLGTVLRRSALPEEAPVQDGVDQNGNAIVGTGDVYIPPDVGMRDALMGTWGDTPAQLEQRRQAAGALTEDQYKQSPSFRKDIPYDPGMTEMRAAALAEMDDVKKVREFYAQKRPLAAFLGGMAGQALDPINYVPVGGPLVKAAAIGRFGRIGGEALAAGLDAAANTALFGVGTANARAQLGDDVSWQALISQIATAGLIGSAFGTVAGAIGRRMDARVSEAEQRLSTLKTTQEARIALNEGIDAIVRGEDANLSPNSTEPLQRVANDIQANALDAQFSTEVRGQAHGQTDMTLRMKVNGADAGRIDFAEADGRPAIQMIEVTPEMRRQGFATQMLQELQSKYPNQQIDWGSLTAEGAKLQEATRFRNVPSESAPLFEQLDAARKTEQALDTERMAKWEQGKPLDQQSQEVQDITARQTEALNTVSALESKLQGVSPTKQIIETPPRVQPASAVDTAKATPEPSPQGVKQAAASIAKPEDAKALAAQYGFDANTGAFREEAEIAQLADEGRLTEQDAQNLAQAQADFETADAYAEALKSVAGCLI